MSIHISIMMVVYSIYGENKETVKGWDHLNAVAQPDESIKTSDGANFSME